MFMAMRPLLDYAYNQMFKSENWVSIDLNFPDHRVQKLSAEDIALYYHVSKQLVGLNNHETTVKKVSAKLNKNFILKGDLAKKIKKSEDMRQQLRKEKMLIHSRMMKVIEGQRLADVKRKQDIEEAAAEKEALALLSNS